MAPVIIPVLLAGGIGERFWPLSRARRPKQLLPLLGRRTMIEETLARVRPLCRGPVRPLIVTSAAIAGPIRAAVRRRYPCHLLVEPRSRNTAPAVALAAAWVERRYGPSVMAVLTADHAISPAAEFVHSLRYAASVAAAHDRLVVFGIPPSRPDTGYGYVEVGTLLDRHERETAYAARRFVEKPDWQTAVRYCRSGRYLWNSGMFVWRTEVVLEEFRRCMPGVYRLARAAARAGFTRDALRRYYGACPQESIDYAIMERSRRVAVVTGHFLWDDVGSWDAVARVRPGNDLRTTVVGPRVFERNCREAIVVNDSRRAVAALGLDGVVVAVTDGAVLVSSRAELPRLKQHLAAMKADGRFRARLF